MRYTFRIPGVSSAVSQVLVHFASVFAVAFGTQLLAGLTGTVSVSTVLALLTASAAAGVIAVAHFALGLIPLPANRLGDSLNAMGISLKVKTAGYQFATSVVVMFVSILGAQLVGGAAGIESLPDVVAVVLSAIAAAVAGVAQALVGLIPAPKAPIAS